ncbi:MAG TPA: hypothetical protein VMY38_00530 [Gemmatimonadaceae bacterium]|nr:hypothetical protein [Gemmatimonadaceae bacterium]
MRRSVLIFGVFFAACAPSASNGTAESETATPAAQTDADPDLTPNGASGLPAGYLGRTDRANTNLSDAKYVVSGDSWEITTGPAHIVYSTKDVGTGNYTVKATIEQLAAPRHREAFGLIFGGADLDTPTQRYSYFVVAGTGEMLVKHRNGETTRDLIGWHKTQWVPAADAQGRQTYNLEVRVSGDSVKFVVNNTVAAALSKSALSLQTDGIAGLRVNHNLSLRATPVAVTGN